MDGREGGVGACRVLGCNRGIIGEYGFRCVFFSFFFSLARLWAAFESGDQTGWCVLCCTNHSYGEAEAYPQWSALCHPRMLHSFLVSFSLSIYISFSLCVFLSSVLHVRSSADRRSSQRRVSLLMLLDVAPQVFGSVEAVQVPQSEPKMLSFFSQSSHGFMFPRVNNKIE